METPRTLAPTADKLMKEFCIVGNSIDFPLPESLPKTNSMTRGRGWGPAARGLKWKGLLQKTALEIRGVTLFECVTNGEFCNDHRGLKARWVSSARLFPRVVFFFSQTYI